MAYQLTISKVLEKAIQKEIESQQLYRHLSEKMADEAAQLVKSSGNTRLVGA